MIDGCDKVLRFSESERAMTHPLDLVVHSFEGSIGDPQFRPGEKAREMLFDEACKLDEGVQPRVSCPPEPLVEVCLGSLLLNIIPKLLKCLFQIISPNEGKVELQQTREPSVFVGSEIPRVLEQDEPSPFEIDPFLASQPFELGLSDFVEGPIQVLDDMEAIEDQSGLRGILSNRGCTTPSFSSASILPRPPA